MKLIFDKIFRERTPNLLKKCGYQEIHDRHSGHFSYVRTMQGGHYPRFHVYVLTDQTSLIELDLHYDAKFESYGASGVRAHSGEYNSDLVLKEAARIKQILNQSDSFSNHANNSDKREEKNKGFWSKIFG